MVCVGAAPGRPHRPDQRGHEIAVRAPSAVCGDVMTSPPPGCGPRGDRAELRPQTRCFGIVNRPSRKEAPRRRYCSALPPWPRAMAAPRRRAAHAVGHVVALVRVGVDLVRGVPGEAPAKVAHTPEGERAALLRADLIEVRELVPRRVAVAGAGGDREGAEDFGGRPCRPRRRRPRRRVERGRGVALVGCSVDETRSKKSADPADQRIARISRSRCPVARARAASMVLSGSQVVERVGSVAVAHSAWVCVPWFAARVSSSSPCPSTHGVETIQHCPPGAGAGRRRGRSRCR